MTNRLLFFFIFCSLTTFAENKLARIVDPDGFSNIRSGPSKEYKIVARIEKDEFFYCDLTNSEWLKVLALKWQDRKQIEGYIHRSRIQFIEDLDNKSKKELFTSILIQQQILAENFHKAYKNNDSLLHKKTIRELENYSEIKYSPILEILPNYFCTTKDSSILQQLITTIWSDASSANEMPSFAIGQCYLCKPSMVLTQIRQMKTTEQRKLIYDNIEWELFNYYEVGEDGISENKDFNRLKNQLDLERNKACL